MRRAALGAAMLVGVLVADAPARAAGNDGLYGRFDGDLGLRAHAGIAFAAGGPALAASLAAVYLSTAGVYVHYTDALGSDAPRVRRSIAGGVHLAPIFLARYASDAERGPPYLDLLLDSLAFELGAVWAAPRGGPIDEHPGLEIALSLDLPILPRSNGPFIGVRGALRWRPTDFAPGPPSSVIDRGALLSITLGWHHAIRAHIVDAGDRTR